MSDPERNRTSDLRFRNQQRPTASSEPQRQDGAGEGGSGADLSQERHNGKGSPAFPADDRRAATGQLRAIRVWLLDPQNAGHWYTLEDLSLIASCSEASASARLRDLRKLGWNVERCRRPGFGRTRFYRVNGRAPLEPAKAKPRDPELDALRARIERLEVELAALSTTTPTGPRLRGTAGGGGAVQFSSEEGQ